MNTVLEDTARYYMWLRLIPGYKGLSSNAKKKAKLAYAAFDSGWLPDAYHPSCEDYTRATFEPINTTSVRPMNIAPCYQTPRSDWISTIEPAVVYSTQANVTCKPATKSKKMRDYYDDFETPVQTRTDEQKKRDYLEQRAYDLEHVKGHEMRKQFNMDAPTGPETAQDLIDAITAGKFTLNKDKAFTKVWYIGDLFGEGRPISWRTADNQKDEKGYEAATDAFAKTYTATFDQIKIADPADGLKAVQALEAWTPTGAAN